MSAPVCPRAARLPLVAALVLGALAAAPEAIGRHPYSRAFRAYAAAWLGRHAPALDATFTRRDIEHAVRYLASRDMLPAHVVTARDQARA